MTQWPTSWKAVFVQMATQETRVAPAQMLTNVPKMEVLALVSKPVKIEMVDTCVDVTYLDMKSVKTNILVKVRLE